MKRILFIFVIFSSIDVMCQISESDTSSIMLNLGANGTYVSGNVERLLIMPNVDFIIKNGNLTFFTSNRYQYGTLGKITTERDLLSRNFIYFYPKNEFYAYLMGWIETSKRKNSILDIKLVLA